MEALLLSLLPDLQRQWQGASEEQIGQIERLAGGSLPRFYRWFLLRMGRSMGPLAYETIDFSADKILTCYAEKHFRPDPRFLLIGADSDELTELHVHYDFDYPDRDDARVVKRSALGGAIYPEFETFREKLAWGKFLRYRVEKYPQLCMGFLKSQGNDVLSYLNPVLASMGFTVPIPTGKCCALYQRANAAMVTSCAPNDAPKRHIFRLGGSDAAALRKILGVVATETSLEVKIKSWTPLLSQ